MTDVSSQEHDDDMRVGVGMGMGAVAGMGREMPALMSEKAMGKRRAADVQPEEDGTSLSFAFYRHYSGIIELTFGFGADR